MTQTNDCELIFITAKNYQLFITHAKNMHKTFITTKINGHQKWRLHKKTEF